MSEGLTGVELAESWKAKANEKYSNKEYAESIFLYSKAIESIQQTIIKREEEITKEYKIESDPSNAVYYGNRAAALIMLKKFKEAQADCEIAISKDPKFLRAYLRLAKCQLELGEFFDSKRAYQKAIELDPNCVAARQELESVETLTTYIERASKLLLDNTTSNTKFALQYLDRAALISTSSKITIIKCKAFLLLKEYEKAALILSKILQVDENNSDALAVRGEALYHMGNHPQATAHLNRAIRFDPDHQRARELIKIVRQLEKFKEEGNAQFNNGMFEEAIESYSSALQVDPLNTLFNSTLYCNRAAAYMKMNKYEEAIEDCNESIKKNENYEKAYSRRATCFIQLEKYEEAVQDYTRSTELDPENNDLNIKLKEAKKLLKISKRKDYYKILELKDKNINDYELKKAYKKAAMKWHPDRHSSSTDLQKVAEAEEKFKEVGEAFALLSDPEKKARYDDGEDIEDIMNGHGGMGHGVDISELFNMFGRGGGGGGGGGFGGGFGGGGGFGHHHHHDW